MKLLCSVFLFLALGCSAANSQSSTPQPIVNLPNTVEAKRCKRECDAAHGRCGRGDSLFDFCDSQRTSCLQNCPGATTTGGETNHPKEPPPPPE